MKKISELTDAELSLAIAKQLGWIASIEEIFDTEPKQYEVRGKAPGNLSHRHLFSPVTDWRDCGPLLEYLASKATNPSNEFCFYFQDIDSENLKRAICEAYLCWKLGKDEVEV